MPLSRRKFNQLALGASLHGALMPRASALGSVPAAPDIKLRLEPCNVEIGKGITVVTTAYNGQVPGPTLRLRRNRPVVLDVTNNTKRSDLVHWHGLRTDPLNDGATEEGSPLILLGQPLRYHLNPELSGSRWYHSHAMAMDDLAGSTYSGQFGFLLIDG